MVSTIEDDAAEADGADILESGLRQMEHNVPLGLPSSVSFFSPSSLIAIKFIFQTLPISQYRIGHKRGAKHFD